MIYIIKVPVFSFSMSIYDKCYQLEQIMQYRQDFIYDQFYYTVNCIKQIMHYRQDFIYDKLYR